MAVKVKIVYYRHLRGLFVPDSEGSDTGLFVSQTSFVPLADCLHSFRVEREIDLPDEIVEMARSGAVLLRGMKKALAPFLVAGI